MVNILLVILIVLALGFAFMNGFNDSASVVATIVASRAMTPRAALRIAAVANFVGPFVFGVAVARTIGQDLAEREALTVPVIIAALGAATIWNLVTWRMGIPSSSSHALIGGLMGAVGVSAGVEALRLRGLWIVLTALFTSPLIGFVAGMIVIRLILWLARGATPKINLFFKFAQVPTAIILSLSHGTNDAQKAMGMITLGLVVAGEQSGFAVPWWVIVACAAAIGLGTAAGGWRIIRTLGGKFYRIRSVHSFASQLSSGLVILLVTLLGGPVSTTQVVSSAILGAGAGHRVSQVRWTVLNEIWIAWLLTLPVSAGLSALLYGLIYYFLGV
ncbi:MAG: inorganic phosphate transporter [Anaerolineales bacterium]|nr:inorganic phosphate transporter [Anaerolineales bacterium]